MAAGVEELNEAVIRHRGGGRDENGVLMPAVSTSLVATAVAPGAGSERLARSRDGEDIAFTVYFPPGTDLGNADELTVRGGRFRIIVNDWRPMNGVGGLEVLCTRGQG